MMRKLLKKIKGVFREDVLGLENVSSMLIAAFAADSNQDIACIIFSKDRPIQLDALLRSLQLNCVGLNGITIVYRASDKSFHSAYAEVLARHRRFISAHEEGAEGFKVCLEKTLTNLLTDRIFFLVDDIVFINGVDFNDLKAIDLSKYIVSLRLNPNLTYSYVVDKAQPTPSFSRINGGLFCWDWNAAELDWAYPLSVDGHCFRRREILAAIKGLQYHSPNTLEASLQVYSSIFAVKTGVCFSQSKIVNIPCNVVQDDFKSRHGDQDARGLLSAWADGFEVDISQFQGMPINSVHMELKLPLQSRQIT
jgi:hypothetical protein